jgi:RHS repeat-associated protein
MVDVSSGEMFYFLNDSLGTPQMLTDATNTVVWEGVYKPFGEAEVNPNSSVVCNFRFPGQYYDTETGFHYNWLRHFDPQTGRYLRPDPIGLAGGINIFLYADGNPINLTDAEGLEASGLVVGAISGGIVGAWSGYKTGGWRGFIGGGLVGAITGGGIGLLLDPFSAGTTGFILGQVSGAIFGPSSLSPSERGPIIYRAPIPRKIKYYPIPKRPKPSYSHPCERTQ